MSNRTITVWSGFVHQGMVALLVALDKIERLEKEGRSLDAYMIQIEGLEDFSFIHGPQTLEVHQVKAWADKSEEKNYSKALKKLESYSGTFDRYLHTAEEITDWQNYSGSVKRYSYPDGSTFFGKKLPDMHRKVLTSEFWGKLGVDSKAAYFALNQSLAECVCDAHLKVGARGNFEAKIGLVDLKNWTLRFQTELSLMMGEILQGMWTGLHRFIEDSDPPVDEEQEARLIDFVKKLSTLDDEAMKTFLINVNPHEEIRRDDPKAFQLFNNSCWKEVFLTILRDVKKLECRVSGHHVPFFRYEKDWWVPTMIMASNKKEITQAIRKNIESSFVVYFDATVLITERIDDSPQGIQDSLLDFVLEESVRKELEKVGDPGIPLLGGKLQKIVSINTATNDLNR